MNPARGSSKASEDGCQVAGVTSPGIVTAVRAAARVRQVGDQDVRRCAQAAGS
jgi:hypothetical protein